MCKCTFLYSLIFCPSTEVVFHREMTDCTIKFTYIYIYIYQVNIICSLSLPEGNFKIFEILFYNMILLLLRFFFVRNLFFLRFSLRLCEGYHHSIFFLDGHALSSDGVVYRVWDPFYTAALWIIVDPCERFQPRSLALQSWTISRLLVLHNRR